MRKTYVSTLIAGLIGVSLIQSYARASLHLNSSPLGSPALTAAQPPPQLTGAQLFFRGQPVDQIIAGTKIKKYSIELTGTGFGSGSSVIVDSSGVCPLTSKPTQVLVTVDQGSSSLLAAFPKRTDLLPGLLSVRVVGPDGSESNTLSVDVISNPADLSIDSISPQSGPVGTQVTLTGVGFKQGDPIRFSVAGADGINLVGFYSSSATASGPVKFAIPGNSVIPICAHCTGSPACDPAGTLLTTHGQYRVSVINANGMSNSLLFQVTP